ncbi:hypothetical protein D3C72_1212470 [compost metagenome]
MLGEVAQFDALRQPDIAADRVQFARQQFNQCGLTRAITPEQTDARTGHQVELDGVENNALAVAGADLLHLQQWVRQAFRGAEAKVERVIHVRRGNHLHALEHLDAALGLFGFGGFGLKAINKALQMGNALLLAFVHRLLL